jgi:Tol biopolymer transport system component
MKKKLIYLTFFLFAIACTNNKKETFPVLTGDYIGQELPQDSALLFAEGIVSTGMADRDVVFYPDGSEIYFCKNIKNFKFATIFYVKQIDGVWTEPKILEFATNPKFKYIEPHISPDGSKLYFASNMDLEGTEPGIMNIWISDRTENGWGAPYSIGSPINTKTDQYFPSVTNEGTIYFTSEDSTNEEFIFRSKLVDGIYQEPEKLPMNINGGRARFNALISPDESFIIVPTFGLTDSYGATDYYIVFRNENDEWSKPINMGNQVNSKNGQEWSASISPDGKYLFFMSARVSEMELEGEVTLDIYNELHNSPQNGLSDIYWVSTDFIEDLRLTASFD